jgi:hypothetical protein
MKTDLAFGMALSQIIKWAIIITSPAVFILTSFHLGAKSERRAQWVEKVI